MKNLQVINQVFTDGANAGVMHLTIEDAMLTGRTVKVKGRNMVNFGSCSYLGLEIDPRLKEASVEALLKYGTQFSASRSYIQLGLYEEFESLLEKIFGYPALLAPTTSLGHISLFPILIGENDAVIYDHQVHSSVQNALKLVVAAGTHTEAIKHNAMDRLEERIKALQNQYEKIWYMADGIYSMYGDGLPAKELTYLLNTYEQFHLYVDDAHGMSWAGKNGSGYTLQEMDYHPRMILTTSLAKSFGSCGGVLVLPDKQTKQLVRNCGSSLMFSGPVQPAILGASIASAKIHLSTEMPLLQAELMERMYFFLKKANELDLLVVEPNLTPIFFIGVGKLEVGYNMIRRMMNKGYYLNLALYPAVSYNKTGLRITITRHQSIQDIEQMLTVMWQELEKALADENSSMEEVQKAFRVRKRELQLADV